MSQYLRLKEIEDDKRRRDSWREWTEPPDDLQLSAFDAMLERNRAAAERGYRCLVCELRYCRCMLGPTL